MTRVAMRRRTQLDGGASYRIGAVPRVRSAARWGALLALLLAPVGCATLPELNASAPDPTEAWRLFQRHCRSCHGALGAGDGPYATAFRAPAPNLLSQVRRTTDPELLVQRIVHPSARPGENAMPAFGDTLGTRQARALVGLLDRLARQPHSDDRDGAGLFRDHCASCHGNAGAGDGPLASEMVPRPRDLTRAWYRVRSTPSGAGPRQADLVATITRGLGVTAMSSFRALGRERIEIVAAHVASLTTVVQEPAARVEIPPAGGAPELARGRDLYDASRCWQCHGNAGRGDGPSARDLRDDGGRASLPANLTRRWRLKGGADVASLARTIANGMNGTPMPSYGEVLASDELWALARYVRELGEPRPETPAALPVQVSEAALPRDPLAAFWREAGPTRVPLGPQAFVPPRWHRPAIDVAEITVGCTEDEVVLLMAWDDPFEDRGAEDRARAAASIDDPRQPGRWRLPDQLAVRLASIPEDGVLPRLYGAGPDNAVIRWVWSADGKPEAAPGERVVASATFDEGRWRLTMVHSRTDPRTRHLLAPGANVALSLQLWEGSQGEQGTRHALSSWIPFTLPPRESRVP